MLVVGGVEEWEWFGARHDGQVGRLRQTCVRVYVFGKVVMCTRQVVCQLRVSSGRPVVVGKRVGGWESVRRVEGRVSRNRGSCVGWAMVALWSLYGQEPNWDCGMGGLKFAGGNLRGDQAPASLFARLGLPGFRLIVYACLLALLAGVEESGSAFWISISISIWGPKGLGSWLLFRRSVIHSMRPFLEGESASFFFFVILYFNHV